jgi:hypothetical protein
MTTNDERPHATSSSGNSAAAQASQSLQSLDSGRAAEAEDDCEHACEQAREHAEPQRDPDPAEAVVEEPFTDGVVRDRVLDAVVGGCGG